ncbi:hypothetical protein JL721_11879 [Aureococcus anophagefferens]|nr:hypothetical protein JL721_11879 [Aureococcus anophagefferens]
MGLLIDQKRREEARAAAAKKGSPGRELPLFETPKLAVPFGRRVAGPAAAVAVAGPVAAQAAREPYPDAKPEESGGKRRKKADDADDEPQPSGLSLTVIMKENPDLSVQEALSKLQIMKQMAGMNMAAGVAQIGSGGAPMLAAIGGQLGAAGPAPGLGTGNFLRGAGMGLGGSRGASGGAASAAAQAASATAGVKPKREVYATRLPLGATAGQVATFDGETAFLELVSVDAAEKAIALDGILWNESALKLGRPRSYGTGNPTGLGSFGNAAPGLNPLMMTSNVLMVSNLPKHLDEADVKKILTPFGKLAELNILKDFDGNVKGAAVFRYAVDAASSDAIAGLNNAKLGDLKLRQAPARLSLARQATLPTPEPSPSSDVSPGGFPLGPEHHSAPDDDGDRPVMITLREGREALSAEVPLRDLLAAVAAFAAAASARGALAPAA